MNTLILMTLLLSFDSDAQNGQGMEQRMDLTLESAIQMALQKNPEVLASKEAVGAAEASRKQTRGRFGPLLKADGNVMVWDDELLLNLASSNGGANPLDAATMPAAPTAFEQWLLQGLGSVLSTFGTPVALRDQVTGQFNLTLTQPLNNLYQVYQGYEVSKLNQAIAEGQAEQTEQKKALDAATGYFRLLQSAAQAETADKSVAQLAIQVKRVNSFVQQGLAARNDLLKIQVAQMAALQTAIRAHSGVAMANAALCQVLGLPLETRIRPITPPPASPPVFSIPIEEAYRLSDTQRLELREVKQRIEQAERGHKVAVANMAPSVAAVAQYSHVEGQKMAEKNSFFAGVFLSWNVWEWGSSYEAVAEASARARQAGHLSEQVGSLLRLEVKKNLIDHQTALEMLKVAQAAQEQAEEGYRIETANFDKGVSTSTDLLIAETAVTQARNNRILAFYECLIAHAGLVKALGNPITPETLLKGGEHAVQSR